MWSLKTTFAVTAAAVAVLATVAVGSTVASLHYSAAADEAAARRYRSFLLADEMRQSSDDLTRLARTFVVSGGEARWARQYDEIVAIRNGRQPRPAGYERIYWDFRAADDAATRAGGESVALLDLMKREGFSEAELAKLAEAQANSEALVRTETVAMNLVKGLRDDGGATPGTDREADARRAREMTHGPAYHSEKARIMKPVDEFLSLLDQRTARELAAASSARQRWAVAAGVAVAAMAALVLGMLFVVRRRTASVLAEAGRIIDGIAHGDLCQTIDARDRSQEGRLVASLDAMQRHLAQVVASIRSGADGVATASDQIAQGNADLSQRTEEQASNLQQTAASMEELGTTVRHNADNAHEADRLAQTASAVAGRGGEIVGQVVEQMRGIDQSSRRIADIIGTVDAIAFQTNILALNAAVEAARAGEQGRGFAVVAGEVRTLAQRAASAAREIKQLIGDSVERVERGAALASSAGATMHEIVESIGRVAGVVGEIATASAEQSQGVAQVGSAVSQMDQVTQQNAALVEESAAAAESLRNQAAQLVQAVARFRVDAAAAAAAAPRAEAGPAPRPTVAAGEDAWERF